jgi:myo-inositol 2-dehydrogenase/D-chiro-inositol 1-dehydrogenase
MSTAHTGASSDNLLARAEFCNRRRVCALIEIFVLNQARQYLLLEAETQLMSDSQRKARIAFIGCGSHANYSLYPSMPELADSVELVAVCDLNRQLAEHTAQKYGVPRVYDDMNAMLDTEELDGVAVIGPPQMHSGVGSQVLRRGLPIFVEKPSAIDVAAATELAQLAEQHNTFGMVAFMKRFAAAYQMTQHLVEQPQFGGVQMVDVKFSQGAYPSIWGIESPALSFLTGQVIHLFDLVRHFGGDVEQVYSNYREVTLNQFGFLVNVTFSSGAIGTLNLNTLDSGEPWRNFEERLAISGQGNLVTVDDMLYVSYQSAEDWIAVPGLNLGRQHHTWRPTGPAARKADELIGYRGELAHFGECALNKTPARPDLWDGAAALQITEAVWRSAQSGEIVKLPPLKAEVKA